MFDTEIDSPPAKSREYTPRDYAVWLTGMLAVCVLGAALTQFFSWRDSQLGVRELTASGVVTEIGHSGRSGFNYGYRFSYDGKTFEGGGSGAVLEVGKKVTIYFDPLDPSTNSFDDFRLTKSWKHSYAVFLFYVSIGLAVILIIRIKTLPPKEGQETDNQSEESS